MAPIKDILTLLLVFTSLTFWVHCSVSPKVPRDFRSLHGQRNGAAAFNGKKQSNLNKPIRTLDSQSFEETYPNSGLRKDVSGNTEGQHQQTSHDFYLNNNTHGSQPGRRVVMSSDAKNAAMSRKRRRGRTAGQDQSTLTKRGNVKLSATSSSTTLPVEVYQEFDTSGKHRNLSGGELYDVRSLREEVMDLDSNSESSPCKFDSHNKENIADCSGLSLAEVHLSWFADGTTILFLDRNFLTALRNETFSHLQHLRVFDASHNKIKVIETCAFCGLRKLEVLNLAQNQLNFDANSYSFSMFAPLRNLRELLIEQSGSTGLDPFSNSNSPTGYLENLIGDLTNLEILSMDTVGEKLYFGKKFAKLTNLKTLQITGHVKVIHNRSFENVSYLKSLTIHKLDSLSSLSPQALQPLQSLDVFRLVDARIGLKDALNILEPLAVKNKSMSTVHLERVVLLLTDVTAGILHNDSILDVEATKFLLKICVKEFLLIDCDVTIVTKEALVSHVWNSCLQRLDLSHNRLLGTRLAFINAMASYKYLQFLKISSSVSVESNPDESLFQGSLLIPQSESSYDPERYLLSVSKKIPDDENHQGDNGTLPSRAQHVNKAHTTTKVSYTDGQAFKQEVQDNNAVSNFKSNGSLNILPSHCIREPSERTLTSHGTVTVMIPDTLKTIIIGTVRGSMAINWHVKGGGSLTYLDLRDMSLYHFTGRLSGITSLQTLILSGNDLSTLSETFFDTFNQLEELYLSDSWLDAQFMSRHSAYLFQTNYALKRLDLSGNLLSFLAKGTFSCNSHLQQLSLAKNRFTHIPFDLRDTAKLVALDLRHNAITSLTSEERGHLDLLAEQSGYMSFFLVWKNKIFLLSKLRQFIGTYQSKKPTDYTIGVFIGYADDFYKFPCHVLRNFIEDKLGLRVYLRHRDLTPSSDMAGSVMEAINNSWRILLVVSEDFLSEEWSVFTIKSAVYAQTPENPSRIVVLVEERLQNDLPPQLLRAVPEDNLVVVPRFELKYELRDKLRTRLLPA